MAENFGRCESVKVGKSGHPMNQVKLLQAKAGTPWSGSSIALLICPAVMLIFGLVIAGYMTPIYSGLQHLDYDPAYQYLFNGAALMKGYGPSHTDHPGTPVQLLIGLISVASWSIATLGGLTSLPFPQYVAANPEQCLRAVMTIFLAMNCI